MQVYKLETYIPANRRLQVVLPDSFPFGEAEIVVLAKSKSEATSGMSLREFSAWLKQQAPSGRSREEIDAQIAEERDSWEDD
ncbi:MAG: hypothetical protein LBR05_10070 [Azoarcus sp.]|nr:hypothetical protein [Azoarcus sp.]